MKKYDIVAAKKYLSNGTEKTTWLRVGTLIQFEQTDTQKPGIAIELNMLPGTTFRAFEQKPREVAPPQTTKVANDDINPDDIPF